MDVDVKLTEHDGPLASPPEKKQRHAMIPGAATPQVQMSDVSLQAAPLVQTPVIPELQAASQVGSLGQLWPKTGESLQMTETVTKVPLAPPPEKEQCPVIVPQATPRVQTPVMSLQANLSSESQSSTVVKLSDIASVLQSKPHGVKTPEEQDGVQGMVPQATAQVPIPVMGLRTPVGSLEQAWAKIEQSLQATVTQDGHAPLRNTAMVKETKTPDNVHLPNPNSESQSSTIKLNVNDIVDLSVLRSKPQGVKTPAGQDGTQGVTPLIPPTIYGTHVIFEGQHYFILSDPPTQAGSESVKLLQPPVCVVAPTQTAAKHQTSAGGSSGASKSTVPSVQRNPPPSKASTSAPWQHKQFYKHACKKIVQPPTAKKDKVRKPKSPYPFCQALGIDLKKRVQFKWKLDLRELSNGVMKELHNFAITNTSSNAFYNALVFDILKKWFCVEVEDDLSYKFSRLVSCKLIEISKKLTSRFEVKAFKLPEVKRRVQTPITNEQVQVMAKNCAKYNIDPKLPLFKIIQRARSRLYTKRRWDYTRALTNEKNANDQFRKCLEKMRSFLDAWVHPDEQVFHPSTRDTISTTTTVIPTTTTVTPRRVDRATFGENNGATATCNNIGSGPQLVSVEPVERETSPQVTSSTRHPGEPVPTVTQRSGEPVPTATQRPGEPVPTVTQRPGEPVPTVTQLGFTNIDVDVASTQPISTELATGEINTVEVTVDTAVAEERPMEKDPTDDDLINDCIAKEHDYFAPLYHSKLSPETSYPICSEMGVNLCAKSDFTVNVKFPVSMLTNAVMMEIHDFAIEIGSSASQVVSRIVRHYFKLDFQAEHSLDSEDWLTSMKQMTTRLKSLKPSRETVLQQTFKFTGEIETRKPRKYVVRAKETNEPSEKYQRLKERSEKRRLDVQKKRDERANQAEERTKKAKQKQQEKYQPHRSRPGINYQPSIQTSVRSRRSPVSELGAFPANLMQYVTGNDIMNFIKEEQEECSVESLNSHNSVSKQSVTVKTEKIDGKDTIKDEHDGFSVAVPVKMEMVERKNATNCLMKDEHEKLSVAVPVKTEMVTGKKDTNITINEEYEELSVQSSYPHSSVSKQSAVPVKTEMVDGMDTIKIIIKDDYTEVSSESSYPHSSVSKRSAVTEQVETKDTINIRIKEVFSSVAEHGTLPVKTMLVERKDNMNIILRDPEFLVEGLHFHNSVSKQTALPVKTEMVEGKKAISILIKKEHGDVSVKSLDPPHSSVSKQSAVPVKTEVVDEKDTIKITIKDTFSQSLYPHSSVSKHSAVPVKTETVDGTDPLNIIIQDVFSCATVSATVRRGENLRNLSENLAPEKVMATSLKRKAETEMEPHPESKAPKTTRY